MSLERPSRSQLVRSMQASIESRLSAEQLRRSDAKVFARAFAGVADALFSYIEFKHRQQFVMWCESEFLDRHASLYGLTRQPAEFATGAVQFTLDGGVVPANSIVQTTDGVRLMTSTDTSPDGIAPVVAELAGKGGNIASGTPVQLVSPIAGVASDAVVSTALEGGVDIESDEDFRSRILQKMRETPMGGASSDYITWAREVPGVTRAWCYPEEDGEGTVVVRFVCDNADSPIPDAEMVARVAAHIETVRPVTAHVSVRAPVAMPVNITFASLAPASEIVKARIEADLRSFFNRTAVPGEVIPISHLRATISNSIGETDHVLAAPVANIVPGDGQLPVLGTITWP